MGRFEILTIKEYMEREDEKRRNIQDYIIGSADTMEMLQKTLYDRDEILLEKAKRYKCPYLVLSDYVGRWFAKDFIIVLMELSGELGEIEQYTWEGRIILNERQEKRFKEIVDKYYLYIVCDWYDYSDLWHIGISNLRKECKEIKEEN